MIGIIATAVLLLSAGISLVTRASAAGNTCIQTFRGRETVTHKTNTSENNYTEEYDYTTGIKLYGAVNNNMSTTGSAIKIDSTALCVDFSGAVALYRPQADSGLSFAPVETGYAFQLLQGSTIRWQARFIRSTYTKQETGEDGQPTTATYVRKTINVNGKTTVTTSESEEYTAFQVSDFGTNTINLSDGTYTLKIMRSYEWTNWKSILNVISYRSASTLTGSLTIDTKEPVLTARGTTSGKTLSNAAITNEHVTVTVADANHARLYYKTPSNGSFLSTTEKSFTSGATNGQYTVYAVDGLGQKSEEFTFYYDDVAPTGIVYDGSTVARENGAYIPAQALKYVASDSGSGIADCYVRMPGTAYYTDYVSGAQLTAEGTYYFKCIDRAGNVSEVTSVTLDKTEPKGLLYAGGTIIPNGRATNAEYIAFEAYDAIGIMECYVKKPNANKYEAYVPGTHLAEEGEYSFYAKDLSGRSSGACTLTLSRAIPSAQLYVDDTPIGNNSYTNGGHIRFESNGKECFVKLPGTDTFTEYLPGTEYYKAGKYTFYGLSESSVSTGYYTVVIDRTLKTADLQNVKDGYTDGDVTLSWENAAPDAFAPVVSVTVNGKPYEKGQTIYTIDAGMYEVIVTDAAGNVWTSGFSSVKRNVFTETLQKEYYEACDAAGNAYSFSTYESALTFAKERENSSVRTGEWNSLTWDTGIAMDAIDSANAKNGMYYIYKKSGSPDERTAYFTRERLNEVIARYARIGICSYYYWEKEPAPAAAGENLYSYSTDRRILADAVRLGENLACLIDGEQFIGSVYNAEGNALLTVCDEWGNTCDYSLTVIRSTPEILYSAGKGSTNPVSYDRTYYLKESVTVSIRDSYDEMAMFSVFDGAGGLLGRFSLGETCELTENGTYTVTAVNHYGVSEAFMLVISLVAPEVSLTENEAGKKLEIVISPSEDDKDGIQTIEIFKSFDGGKTWSETMQDDYGHVISADTLAYAFRTSALYKVVVTDRFRTGIDAIVVQLDYVQPAPEGMLIGVENGGYTNAPVKFVWTDEATVLLEKDGTRILYASGRELTEDGVYTLTFENFDGYEAVYTFTIDTLAPEASLQGAENGETVNGDVCVVFEEEEHAELFRNGTSLGEYLSGSIVSTDGEYRVVVRDCAGNETVVAFGIDKTVNYAVNVNDKGLANSVTVTAGESVSVCLTGNGEAIDYMLGDAVTEPARYVLTITDRLGNRTEISFEIVRSLVKEFVHDFSDVEGLDKMTVNGEEIQLNHGMLELKTDGEYEVEVVVNGIVYPFSVEVDGTAPTVTLKGVDNGGVTKGGVVISDLSETAVVQVYRDGEEIAYKLGNTLVDTGRYEVVVTDACGNSTRYAFEIEKGASRWWIALIVLGGLAVIAGSAAVILKKREIF